MPVPQSRFLGRIGELREVVSLLSEEGIRLLTITGPGGIGKTRLALRAAEELAGTLRDGAAFVPLGPVESPDDLPQAIASGLGAAFPPSADSLPEQLLHHLRGRSMLLVLDSFEHLIEGSRLVFDILDAAGEILLLVTSRSPLGIPGETVLELRGMLCPGEAPSGLPGSGEGALDLFEQSAARTVPGFRLTWDLQPLAAEICRLLEGLPLAIELASSWLASMSLAEVYQEILRNPALLGTGGSHLPTRHRNLLDVVEGTWRLLSPEEQRVMEAVSCFRGSFSAEGACSVAETDPETLSSLCGKSLLRREEGDLMSLHEVTWRFAGMRLGEDPSRVVEIRGRHCACFAEMTERLEEEQWISGRKALIAELSRNLENLRSAWRWAVECGDTRAVGRLLGPLYSLYTSRGWYRDGERMLSEALRSLSDRGYESDRDRVLGSLRMRLGWIHVSLGAYDEGQRLLEESLAAFRAVRDKGLESMALYYLSSMALFRGDYGRAEALGSVCVESAVASGDDHRLASAWLAKGNIARRMGRFGDAREFYEESLALHERLGDDVGRAVCLGNLGITAFRLGELEDALELCRRSLAISEELGDQRLIAECCCDLGNIFRDMDRMAEAGEHYSRSLRLNRELGLRSATAIALVNIGLYERRRGNLRKAGAHMAEAHDIATALGRRPIAMQTLGYRGWIELDLGREAEAVEIFRRGLGMMPGFSPVSSAVSVLAGIAALAARRGDRTAALDTLGFILGRGDEAGDCAEECRKAISFLDPAPTEEEIARWVEARRSASLDDIALELMETAFPGRQGMKGARRRME